MYTLHVLYIGRTSIRTVRCTSDVAQQDLIARVLCGSAVSLNRNDKQPPLASSSFAQVTIMFSTQQDYGATENLNGEPASPYHLQEGQNGDEQQGNVVTPQAQPMFGANAQNREEPASPYHLQEGRNEECEQQPQGNANQELGEEYEMSLTELLYSSSSYHAIVKPGTFEFSPEQHRNRQHP